MRLKEKVARVWLDMIDCRVQGNVSNPFGAHLCSAAGTYTALIAGCTPHAHKEQDSQQCHTPSPSTQLHNYTGQRNCSIHGYHSGLSTVGLFWGRKGYTLFNVVHFETGKIAHPHNVQYNPPPPNVNIFSRIVYGISWLDKVMLYIKLFVTKLSCCF